MTKEWKFLIVFQDNSICECSTAEDLLQLLNANASLEGIKEIFFGYKLTPITRTRVDVIGFKEFGER